MNTFEVKIKIKAPIGSWRAHKTPHALFGTKTYTHRDVVTLPAAVLASSCTSQTVRQNTFLVHSGLALFLRNFFTPTSNLFGGGGGVILKKRKKGEEKGEGVSVSLPFFKLSSRKRKEGRSRTASGGTGTGCIRKEVCKRARHGGTPP